MYSLNTCHAKVQINNTKIRWRVSGNRLRKENLKTRKKKIEEIPSLYIRYKIAQ